MLERKLNFIEYLQEIVGLNTDDLELGEIDFDDQDYSEYFENYCDSEYYNGDKGL